MARAFKAVAVAVARVADERKAEKVQVLDGSLNAFPGGRHLDQHPVNVHALGLVQLQ